MFDSILALDTKLAAKGMPFSQLVSNVASAAHLCLSEKIEIAMPTGNNDFCPAAKSANPEATDGTIFDYVFTDSFNNVLTVKEQGDVILSAQYLDFFRYHLYMHGSGLHRYCAGSGSSGSDTGRGVCLSRALRKYRECSSER